MRGSTKKKGMRPEDARIPNSEGDAEEEVQLDTIGGPAAEKCTRRFFCRHASVDSVH